MPKSVLPPWKLSHSFLLALVLCGLTLLAAGGCQKTDEAAPPPPPPPLPARGWSGRK